MKLCKQRIIDGDKTAIKEDQCFTLVPEIIKQALRLSGLTKMGDQLISDNGYKSADPRIKRPHAAPQTWCDDKRIIVNSANWRRAVTLIRQSCERMHSHCKDSAFARSILSKNYVCKAPLVWDILTADIVRRRKLLQRDHEAMNHSVAMLNQLRHVTINYIEIWYIPKLALKYKPDGGLNRKRVAVRLNTNYYRSKVLEFWPSEPDEMTDSSGSDTDDEIEDEEEADDLAALRELLRKQNAKKATGKKVNEQYKFYFNRVGHGKEQICQFIKDSFFGRQCAKRTAYS